MANPGDANLTLLEFWKYRGVSAPMTPFACKKGGQKNIGDKAMSRATSARMGSSAQGVKDGGDFVGRQPYR